MSERTEHGMPPRIAMGRVNDLLELYGYSLDGETAEGDDLQMLYFDLNDVYHQVELNGWGSVKEAEGLDVPANPEGVLRAGLAAVNLLARLGPVFRHKREELAQLIEEADDGQ